MISRCPYRKRSLCTYRGSKLQLQRKTTFCFISEYLGLRICSYRASPTSKPSFCQKCSNRFSSLRCHTCILAFWFCSKRLDSFKVNLPGERTRWGVLALQSDSLGCWSILPSCALSDQQRTKFLRGSLQKDLPYASHAFLSIGATHAFTANLYSPSFGRAGLWALTIESDNVSLRFS